MICKNDIQMARSQERKEDDAKLTYLIPQSFLE